MGALPAGFQIPAAALDAPELRAWIKGQQESSREASAWRDKALGDSRSLARTSRYDRPMLSSRLEG